MLTYLATVRAFSRDARLLFATQALASISYIGIYLVLFNLYLVRLGYDTAFIGWINGVSFLSFALFSLPAGMVGARRGLRWAAIVGLLVAGIGLALTPLAEFVPIAWQAQWLVITYILAWIGAAFYSVNFIPSSGSKMAKSLNGGEAPICSVCCNRPAVSQNKCQ